MRNKLKQFFKKLWDKIYVVGLIIGAFIVHIFSNPFLVGAIVFFVLLQIFKPQILEIAQKVIDYFYYKIGG